MNNVNYKFILGWDIFTMSDNDQWSTTNKYSNVNSKLLKDEFESSKKLWENIDFSKFWFFENENVKYGGITQWTHYNCESSDWYKSEKWKKYEDDFKAVNVKIVYFPYTKGTSSTLINDILLKQRNK